ncbi:diguanylate cyclase [Saccharobesus litoralis]|uniref:Diguanylate cyclase n=1 Tax=Saccharobesus litoralis TaxID=2172099 RepID=A0A2S0VQ87_9ALTE|nr:EAL domain-containing protein [Saccharobesus litoralis]AWB66374.1 diguanylate cyclase [Saccharobesus litoralis]
MHRLLSRILRKKGNGIKVTPETAQVLDEISKAFEQCDTDRAMLEHSLQLVSDELNEINSQLKHQLKQTHLYQEQTIATLARQQALVDASPEAVFSFNREGQITDINIAGCQFFDKTREDLFKLDGEQVLLLALSKLEEPDVFINDINAMFMDKFSKLHGFFKTKNKRIFEFYCIPEIANETKKYLGRVWCCRDVTEIREQQNLLKHKAYHDNLTNLPNRALLIESIKQAVNRARRSGKHIAVMFIDLDDFKKINDTLSHAEGDKFLITVANRFKQTLREEDLIGRLGGDEFLVLLEQTDDLNNFDKVAKRLLSTTENSFFIKGHEYRVTSSIGIAVYPKDGKDADELISKADIAMYQAKHNGKNSLSYFDEKLEKDIQFKLYQENKLRKAIEQKSFVMHYQPQFCMETKNIVGLEALVRWRTEQGTLLYPDSFISLAEELGVISQITLIVLEKVITDIKQWQQSETVLSNIPVAINMSALDFDDKTFIDGVFDYIKKANITPELLKIELTETAIFKDVDYVKQVLSRLQAHSIGIAIDDFGTGYSSFAYLKDLAINTLKIDKSFIEDFIENKTSEAIVQSIIALAHNLNLNVVAEGVETEKEELLLKSMKCDIGQGYQYAKPLNKVQLLNFVLCQSKLINQANERAVNNK